MLSGFEWRCYAAVTSSPSIGFSSATVKCMNNEPFTSRIVLEVVKAGYELMEGYIKV
jgi:hypothetical protein